MNILDILIIYLACGAPFGVFYFLQNRKTQNQSLLWLKSVLHFLFWLPSGFYLLRQYFFQPKDYKYKFANLNSLDLNIEKKIFLVEKRLEEFFIKSDLNLSIFEFREILNRFSGLSIIISENNSNSNSSPKARELYRISGHKNTELAGICLHRRNQNQLLFHQNLARKDFLNIISRMFAASDEQEKLSEPAIEFVTLLNDSQTLKEIKKIFEKAEQNRQVSEVKQAEKVLWKSQTQQLHTGQISTPLQTIAATMNLPRKD